MNQQSHKIHLKFTNITWAINFECVQIANSTLLKCSKQQVPTR